MQLHVIYYTLYALSIVGILIVAGLVYMRRREEAYKHFAIFAALLDVWLSMQFFAQLFSNNLMVDATLLMRITSAVGPFFAVYFYFFAVLYVGNKVKKAKHFILPTIGGLTAILTDVVVQGASASINGIVLRDGPMYYVVSGIVVGYSLVAASLITKEVWTKNNNVSAARKQANAVLVFAVLQAVVIVSIVAVFFADEPLSQVMIPFTLFLMVVIFGYAIVRHRLFDIRLAAVRALAYSFSLATLAAVYSLLAFGLANTFLGGHDNLPQQLFYLAVALLLALTFAPLKSFFDRITRTVFYQDAYEPQKVIDEFNSVLVNTVDIEDLSHRAAEVLRKAIKSQYIAILLPPEDITKKAGRRVIVNGQSDEFKEDSLYKLLSQRPEKLIIQDEMLEKKGRLFKSMQASNSAIAVRLETHGELKGYVLFGLKNNGRAYTSQDIELIHTVSDELALGIQNALRFEEIRSFNRTLQERIEEATAQLRRTNAQLRRLDETKDEFLSMASHQLRTPLTSVKGYISMVLDGDVGKITNEQRRLLGEAFTSSERMVHLIGDFLNVSRLQTGKFILESKTVNLAKVIEQEVESLQTTAKAHNMKLQYRTPAYFPVLYIDEGKIRQVLMNFIDNAIFYSREHTTITVKLVVEGGEVVATVHDTGIGVPKDEQSHLFTKFFRATNARKQRPDGTGVGLFLAKKVVDAHGGSIMFESTEGEGSTFGFRLPVKKLSTAPKQAK